MLLVIICWPYNARLTSVKNKTSQTSLNDFIRFKFGRFSVQYEKDSNLLYKHQ